MITLKHLTIRDIFYRSQMAFADRPSLSFVGKKNISYATMATIVKNLSGLLLTIGIKKGDRVALIGENSPNWGMAYLSITTIGAVVVPVLPDFSSTEMESIITHSGAKVVFVSAKIFNRLNISGLKQIDSFILLNSLEPINEQSYNAAEKHEYKLPCTNINLDYSEVDFPRPQEDDLAAIIYTSGTTGRPKGVMLSHKNLISNLISTSIIQHMDENDRLLSILPLPHTYECSLGFLLPIATGAAVYYLEKPPTAAALIPAMQMVRPTMMLSVPLVIEKIYRAKIRPELTSTSLKKKLYAFPPTRKLLHRVAARKLHQTMGGCLHFFGVGGAKLSFDTEQFLYEGKFPYSIGYGLTETSPLISGCTPKIVRMRCAGYCLPGQELKIHNPNPETGEGEILVRGCNVMSGYYKEPKLTQEVFLDGWFRTGDLGMVDSHGYVQIMGRSKNMILSASGENIYPEEIEDVINKNEMVVESLVYEMKGKLMARVHLNHELIEKYISNLHISAHNLQLTAKDMQKAVEEYSIRLMGDIMESVNSKVSRFARLSKIVEQVEPFEKTPTQKIKRFIYKN